MEDRSADQPRDAEVHAASTRSDRSGDQPHHMTEIQASPRRVAQPHMTLHRVRTPAVPFRPLPLLAASSPSLRPEPPLPLYLRVVCPSNDQTRASMKDRSADQPRDAEDHAASTRSDTSGDQPHMTQIYASPRRVAQPHMTLHRVRAPAVPFRPLP